MEERQPPGTGSAFEGRPGELVEADRREEVRESATALSQLEIEAREAATDVAAPDDPKLALIDFGMTAHLPQRMRDSIVRLLMGIAENHGERAAEAARQKQMNGNNSR